MRQYDLKKLSNFITMGMRGVVEPYAYGIHKDTGNEVLRAFQIGGYSFSGKNYDWRLYTVSKMTNILITGEFFEQPRLDYKMNDSQMSQIFCQIEL